MSDNQFVQDWWDKNLATRYEEFASWIGDSTATSKKMFREYVKSKGYKSLIDFGCGNATEFFAYKEEYPELEYMGADSSTFLYTLNISKGIPMALVQNDKTLLLRNQADIVFSRHVLEHQPSFKPLLVEMVRLALTEVLNVFFIPPQDKEIINYDPADNLYHNTFCKQEIEDFLKSLPDVDSFTWIPVTSTEVALSIIKKENKL